MADRKSLGKFLFKEAYKPKIRDLPDNLRIFVCDHVVDGRAPDYFGRDAGGDFSLLCCDNPQSVKSIGFGHFKDTLKSLLDEKMLYSGEYFEREHPDVEWKRHPQA